MYDTVRIKPLRQYRRSTVETYLHRDGRWIGLELEKDASGALELGTAYSCSVQRLVDHRQVVEVVLCAWGRVNVPHDLPSSEKALAVSKTIGNRRCIEQLKQ